MCTGKKSRNQSGMTLLEVLVAFSVLLIGLMTLFKVATVASSSNLRTRQFQTALTKASDVLELMKEVPTQTIACLAGGGDGPGCYNSCIDGGADPVTCGMALGTDAAWFQDQHGITFVPAISGRQGTDPFTYEVEVVISWTGNERVARTHRIYLKSMVYRP